MPQSIIKNRDVRLSEAPAPPLGADRGQPCRGLRVLRDRGVVVAVELTCACGETTVVELDYPEPVDEVARPSEALVTEPAPAPETTEEA